MENTLLKNHLDYLRQRNRRSTVEKKQRELELFLLWCDHRGLDITVVSYQDILTYIDHCMGQGRVAPSSMNSYLGTIREFYGRLALQGVVKANPAGSTVIRGEIRKSYTAVLDETEMEKLYTQHPSTGLVSKRNRCILGFLVFQGLTSPEISRLEVNHLKLTDGTIYVPSVQRSNSRTLKLEALQALHLQNYMLQVRGLVRETGSDQGVERLFLARKAQHLSGVVASLTRQIRKQNPKIKTLHDLRSSVICNWLKKHHIRQVQYMAGHRWVGSTYYYQGEQLKSLAEQLEKLHPMK